MNTIRLLLTSGIMLLALSATAYAQSFDFFRELTATNTSATPQTDVPVPVLLDDSNFDFGNVRADGLDIRFSSNANPATLELDYYLEVFDEVEEVALFWVNLPSIPANDSVVFFMFYGDASFDDDDSDRDATFPNRWISSVNGPMIDAQLVHEYDWFEVESGDTVDVIQGDPGLPIEVLEIRAARIIIDGTINLDGIGYAGGDAEEPGEDDGTTGGGGEEGENTLVPTGQARVTGGGGGGYGGAGGEAGASQGTPASGGNAYDAFQATGLGVELGSGGGGGVSGGAGTAEGGAGGGAIDVRGMFVTMEQGTISANGLNGTIGDTGGGGGSGGGILLGGYHLILIDPMLEARGGSGGDGASGGGGGGGGIIRVAYDAEFEEDNFAPDVDGGAAGFGGNQGDDGDNGEVDDFQNSDVIDEILVSDVGPEQLVGSVALPPVLEVTSGGSAISENDVLEVATGSTLNDLGIVISVSDPDNLDVDVTVAVDPEFDDFEQAQWEVTGASTDPFVNLEPQSGTFNDNTIHEITVTATNTGTLSDSLTFFIFVGPRITVLRDNTEIPHEDTDDIGSVPDGDSINVTYTIRNDGQGPLELTGDPVLALSANNADVFVVQQPDSSISDSTTFTLQITPDGTGPGTFSVDVVIEHNATADLDEPYEFTIEGEVEPAPRLTLTDPMGRDVIHGDPHFIGYLRSYALQEFAFEYTIRNDGDEDLVFGDPVITVNDMRNATVTVDDTTVPAELQPSEDASFFVEIEPEPSGPFSFVLIIESNDPRNESFHVLVEGWATTIPQSRPQIERPATRPILSGGTHDAGLAQTGAAQAYTFTVRNIGVEELTLADGEPVFATGVSNATVTITEQPAVSELAYAETTTFEIEVEPLEDGPWEMRLSLANDSPMLPDYWIRVIGHGVSEDDPAIRIERLGNVVIPHDGVDEVGMRPGGEASVLVYWIRSVGTEPLNLTLPVTISASNNVSVSVTRMPEETLPAFDGLTPLVLRITPNSGSMFSFNVTVESDDESNSPLTFTVAGNTPVDDPEGIKKYMGGCNTGAGTHTPLLLLLAAFTLLALRRRHHRALA